MAQDSGRVSTSKGGREGGDSSGGEREDNGPGLPAPLETIEGLFRANRSVILSWKMYGADFT